MTDENGQVYLRARYYTPVLGVFPSRDPFEGLMDRPMSLNGYSWVEGNVVNAVDPSGKFQVDIWVAAFISPSSIDFLFSTIPEVFTIGRWHGDRRSRNTLQDFASTGSPPSSCVW